MVKKSDPAQMQGGNRRVLVWVPGNVGTCDLTDVQGLIRVARATGGVPVSVCNVSIDLWILGYRYGYVTMSRYTGLRVICQHVPLYNPYVDMGVYPGGS